MIKALKASWGVGTATITSPAELRSLIERVRELKEPTMLFLEATTGSTLVVGLGAKESVLTFAEKDGTSFHSVGDTRRTGYLQFRCRDTVDDFHAEMAIPEPAAIEAALEFLETGRKPQGVLWEADS
jgi:hypothetical protein